MLRAALWNATSRVVIDRIMQPIKECGADPDDHDWFESIVNVFVEEFEKPAPQMEAFIRHNHLRYLICNMQGNHRLARLRQLYGPLMSVAFAQRIFEQQIYDFGRSIGLTKEQAVGHVIKVRQGFSKYNVDMLELGDYESYDCEELLKYLDTPQPEVMRTGKAAIKYAKKARKAEIRARKEARRQGEEKATQTSIDHQMEILNEQNSLTSGPKHPSKIPLIQDQDKLPTEKKIVANRKSESDILIESAEHLPETQLLEDQDKLLKRKEIEVDRKSECEIPVESAEYLPGVELLEDQDKPLQKKKKGRKRKSEPELPVEIAEQLPKVELGEDQEKPLKKKKRRRKPKSEPEIPFQSAEQLPTFQLPKDQEKPPKQKKKGTKLKNELELPEEPLEDHGKLKQVGDDSDAPSHKSKKSKRMEDGPQHSPFFQRSGLGARKDDAHRLAEKLTGLELPMIQ